MCNWLKSKLSNTATRHYVRIVAFVVLGASVGAFLMLMVERYSYMFDTRFFFDYPPTNTSEEIATTSVYALPRSSPISLHIAKLNLTVDFEESLGLNADKTIQVPRTYDKVGWYKYGSTPGEIGPAVILGHVDSYKGPAVFFSLGQLASGDLVDITREDGSIATFKVTKLERYSQDEFPTELVYGPTSNPSLRLITCSGVYDHGTLKYSHNLVVYAELVNPENLPIEQ